MPFDISLSLANLKVTFNTQSVPLECGRMLPRHGYITHLLITGKTGLLPQYGSFISRIFPGYF